LPDTPTFAEAGFANYNVINYTGLWAPKGTPVAVLQRLQKEIGVAMQSPDIKEFAEGIGAVPKVVLGDAFAKMLKENTQMWGRVASTAKIEKQ
jgi:tripartite-type tricarboxylate transporter receptor subunit TctC